ncbi:hypothetical protein [Leucobacter luti]|uniref:Lipoprotein n=1 Tax=Leucobacter luti TaxID=340320 RepID=A0A4Q7TKL1_9MICO|nr:hypothetical protein [Leucobacter luti]MBL3700322.1 hypothetical protein [Leucobacter luti]RZT60953.1 hypothetical protein EV139_2699 [Leucobacter luti]
MANITGLRRLALTAGSILIGATLVGTLTACAPEPGASVGTEAPTASGHGPEEKPEGGSGESWTEQDSPDDFAKESELPASFPKDQFVFPESAVIDDTGARSDTEWFIVFRAADQASADVLWESIVSASGFARSDEVTEPDGGGRSAELRSQTLAVSALTIPQPDGTILLSYDVTAA